MKPFFFFSTIAHGMLVAALIVVGTLLSKPRMSYYAVDLFNSSPAGGGAVGEPSVAPVSVQAPKMAPAPRIAPAPRMVAPEPVAEEEASDQDTIRLLAKLKKKRLGLVKSQPAASTSGSASGISRSPVGVGRGGVGLPGTGSGIVADAGPAFPYPWYLKAIADRLDKQWHPPQEFEPDTVCQVSFTIDPSGQVSGAKVSKSSGDTLFDQVALRAVLYSNPLPPLPNGFPDNTLKVHMKFVGRRL